MAAGESDIQEGDRIVVCGTPQDGKLGTVREIAVWGRYPVKVDLDDESGVFAFHPSELRRI